MVNFMMAVNRYCADCMKDGEFLPLHFVMMNIHTGMWMCPKTECIFPMNSNLMQDYIEEDMTTEKVLQLAKLGRRRSKGGLKNFGEVTKDSLNKLKNTNSLQSSISEASSKSAYTSSSTTAQSSTMDDDASSTISSWTSRRTTLSSSTSKKTVYYPLWENTSLLCWLDAALAMLVLNTSMTDILSDESDCLIGHLFTEYKKILISYNTFLDYKLVQSQLDRLRTNMLKFLQPKLHANYGDEDSPLVSLPLVFRTSATLSEDLEISYRCIFQCHTCGFERKDGFKKIVMTLPNTSNDLDFNNNIYFSRACYKCFTDHQKTRYEIEKFPKVMFVHFPQGVQCKRCWEVFNFTTPDGEEYIVTQIVQYITKKRHFITWSYNYEEKLWLEADDLKEPVSHHKHRRPRCRPQEVHIVIWERLSFLRNRHSTSKTCANKLNSPNSLSVHEGSSTLVSLSGSPDELPSSEDLATRTPSVSSSLSSFDSVSACGRGSQPGSSNPYRPVKDVLQKGLRNTPRYEPYIPRQIKKEMGKYNPSGETVSMLVKEDNFNLNRLAYQVKVKTDDTAVNHTKSIKNECGSGGKVSLDFLKGVLSEELNDINDEFLLNTNKSDCKIAQNTPKKKSKKVKAADFIAEQSLDDLCNLFDI